MKLKDKAQTLGLIVDTSDVEYVRLSDAEQVIGEIFEEIDVVEEFVIHGVEEVGSNNYQHVETKVKKAVRNRFNQLKKKYGVK